MHQPKLLILSAVLLLSILASFSGTKDVIEIKGDIKGLDTGWAYLYNTYSAPKPFDSAKVISGNFSFKFTSDTLFEPRSVYMRYRSKKGRWEYFKITNPYSKNKDKLDRDVNFLMEGGTIELKGDFTKNHQITLIGGTQNDYRFKSMNLFELLIDPEPTKHKQQVDSLLTEFKAAPNSWWALQAMGRLQYQLTGTELQAFINTFDEQLRQTYRGKKLQEFLALRPRDNDLRPNNLLTTPDGKQVAMIDTTKKLNMLIFWASWCGPCRMEIPALKKIAAQIKDNGFRMVSISTDQSQKDWRQALAVEKMPWEQLIPGPKLDRVDAQYGLGSIPQIYLIGGDRKLISILNGFDPENEPKLIRLINDHLATK